MLGFAILSAVYIAVFLWNFPSGSEENAIVVGFVVAAISIAVAKVSRMNK